MLDAPSRGFADQKYREALALLPVFATIQDQAGHSLATREQLRTQLALAIQGLPRQVEAIAHPSFTIVNVTSGRLQPFERGIEVVGEAGVDGIGAESDQRPRTHAIQRAEAGERGLQTAATLQLAGLFGTLVLRLGRGARSSGSLERFGFGGAAWKCT